MRLYWIFIILGNFAGSFFFRSMRCHLFQLVKICLFHDLFNKQLDVLMEVITLRMLKFVNQGVIMLYRTTCSISIFLSLMRFFLNIIFRTFLLYYLLLNFLIFGLIIQYSTILFYCLSLTAESLALDLFEDLLNRNFLDRLLWAECTYHISYRLCSLVPGTRIISRQVWIVSNADIY
jgi:hypothetical protein